MKMLGRYRCSDAIGLRHIPVRDQGEEPGQGEEEGELVCRIVEDKNGNMHVLDAGKARLRARRAKDGTLEIRHLAEEATGDDADPEIVGEAPGIGGDPARAADPQRTGDALSRFRRNQRSEDHMGALRDYQAQLDRYYRQ